MAGIDRAYTDKNGKFYDSFVEAAAGFTIAYEPFDNERACAKAKVLYGGNQLAAGLLVFQ